MASSKIVDIPRWRKHTLLIVWLGVLVLWLSSEWLQKWVHQSSGFDWTWKSVPDWLQLGQALSAMLKWLACFLIGVLGGAYIFKLLAWPYWHPIRLIMHATFPDDLPPTVGFWPPHTLPRRILEWMFYYRGVFSLSATRRFLFVAFHPWIAPVRNGGWLPYRISFLDIGPERMYEKLQLYIEAELFHPQRTAAPARETEAQHATRIEHIYRENVWIYGNGGTPDLLCKTCFDVFGPKHGRILQYLGAQQQLQRPPRFLSKITFDIGYIAPTYLVSGPLNEFDEDWTKLVGAYREKMTLAGDPLEKVRSLRKLQSFTWDCWVQWGPSVPVSDAPAWKDGAVALQFGYGDEDNSLPMFVNQLPIVRTISAEADEPERCRVVLQDLHNHYGTVVIAELGWAWPVKVSGYLRWMNRQERNEKLCSAQRDYTQERPDRGWLAFDAERLEQDNKGALLYSAYVWALFAICRESFATTTAGVGNDEPKSTALELVHINRTDADGVLRDERWRGLMPFFRHGNIAEATVFQDTKRELAQQIIDTLVEQVSRARAAGETWLQFAFVASFDNNGDNDRSHPVSPPPGKSIPALLKAAYDERSNRATPEELECLKAIHVATGDLAELTATDLPQIVGSYLAHVERLSRSTT